MGRNVKRIAPEVMNVFESHSWPGNVRELENVIERVVAIEERNIITKESLPEELFNPRKKPDTSHIFEPSFNLQSYLDEIAITHIRQARQATSGNLKETASLLGMSYRTLRYLIDKYKIKYS